MQGQTVLFTRETSAAYVSTSLSTFNRLVKQGKITPVRFGVKMIRFRKDDLDSLIIALQSQPDSFTEKTDK